MIIIMKKKMFWDDNSNEFCISFPQMLYLWPYTHYNIYNYNIYIYYIYIVLFASGAAATTYFRTIDLGEMRMSESCGGAL